MTGSSDNTRRTVARMKIDALESAAAYQRDVEATSVARRIEHVEGVIADLAERFEEDRAVELAAQGIAFEFEDGRLVLEKAGKTFVIRPREDMTFVADGVIIQLDPDFPALTEDIELDVLRRVLAWAGVSDPKQERYFR